MASNNALFLNLGTIIPVGMADLERDDASPYQRAGTLSLVVDAYGPRILQYVQNQSGSAFAKGELVKKVANTAVNNITAGSTTSATTTGLTVGDHAGKLCYVLDNDDSAGAAPEGQVSIVAGNTATIITIEGDYAFGTALAANDDLVLISNWQATDAADGDIAINELGVVLAVDGVANNDYGWVQKEGYVVALLLSGAITAGDPVVADAAQIGAFGTDGQELWVGYALAAVSADQTAERGPVNLKLFSAAGPGTAP